MPTNRRTTPAEVVSLAHLQQQIRRQRRISTAMIAALAVVVLLGATRPPQAAAMPTSIEELTVQRLNLVEPDGTLRLVMASRGRFPGDFYRGAENPRPDRRHVAGLLFLDDQGTEVGGLIYGARHDGEPLQAGMSLTFDRCRQDQVLQLLHEEGDGRTRTGVVISDRPDSRSCSIADLKREIAAIEALPAPERQARFEALERDGKLGATRAYLGTTADQGSMLSLRDAQGRPRLRLLVTAAGEPRLQVLDERGEVQGNLAVVAVPAAEPK
jgi:hypothetical protein